LTDSKRQIYKNEEKKACSNLRTDYQLCPVRIRCIVRRGLREKSVPKRERTFFNKLIAGTTMKEESKRYWRERLIEQGIIEPEKPKPKPNIFLGLWSRVRQLYAKKCCEN